MTDISNEIQSGKTESFEILKLIYSDNRGTKYEKSIFKEIEILSSFLTLKKRDYENFSNLLTLIVNRYDIKSFHSLVYVLTFLYRICNKPDSDDTTILREMLFIMGIENEALVKNLGPKFKSFVSFPE